MKKYFLITIMLFTAFATAVALLPARLSAQTTIEFIVAQAADGSTGITPGASGDSILFIGSSSSNSPLGGCGTGGAELHPVQNAIAMDTGAGDRPTRLLGVIHTTSTDAIPPGTRLNNLSLVTNCTGPDSMTWTKYRGEVD